MRFRFLLFIVLFAISVGCAPKVVQKDEKPVFFPPEPNPPRVQFLLGIGDSRDVEPKGKEFSLVSLNAVQTDEVKTFIKPYGVATWQGKIYVSDTLAGNVGVIDLEAQTFDWLKGDFGPGKLKKPINMTTDSEGHLYVTDTVRKKVIVYDSEGNFVRTYGEAYDMVPVDVAVDDKRLYVLDRSRSKILVYDKKSGDVIEGLGQESDNPLDNLALPTNMAMTDKGIFYVTNIGTGKIIKLDRDGHQLGAVGGMGDGFGQFGRPKGIATDSKNRFYVVDANHHNVQLFDENSRLLMFFGDPGLPVGSLNLPAGIVVTDQKLDFYQKYAADNFKLEQIVMVVSQVGQHKLSIYGLGKKTDFDYDAYYKESEEILRKADESRAKKKK